PAGVSRLHPPAILNPYAIGKVLVPLLRQVRADESVNFLRLRVGGVSTGADRPDRFVRNHQPVRIVELWRIQFVDLPLHDIQRLARVALFEFLADAVDEDQAVAVNTRSLAGDKLTRFLDHMPALAVS